MRIKVILRTDENDLIGETWAEVEHIPETGSTITIDDGLRFIVSGVHRAIKNNVVTGISLTTNRIGS